MLVAEVQRCVQQRTNELQCVHPDAYYKQRVCGEQVLEVQHEEVKDNLLAAEASKATVLRKFERQGSGIKESIKVTLHSPNHDPCTRMIRFLCLKYDLDAFWQPFLGSTYAVLAAVCHTLCVPCLCCLLAVLRWRDMYAGPGGGPHQGAGHQSCPGEKGEDGKHPST